MKRDVQHVPSVGAIIIAAVPPVSPVMRLK